MEYLVFDVEATGLDSKDEVTQFSAFKLDENFNIKKFYNFHCYTTVRISEGAKAVTKVDTSMLLELSKMGTFEDNFLAIPDFHPANDVVWVGYNVLHDINRINRTLVLNRLPEYYFGEKINFLSEHKGISYFDLIGPASAMTLKGSIRNVNLTQAINALVPGGMTYVEELYRKLIAPRARNIPENLMAHNSLFDSFGTSMLLKKVSEQYR